MDELQDITTPVPLTNVGGQCALKLIQLSEVTSVPIAVGGLVNFAEVVTASPFLAINFLVETLLVDINYQSTTEGNVWQVQVQGLLPKNRLDLRQELEKWTRKELACIVTDFNGMHRFLCQLGNPLIMRSGSASTGQSHADLNAFEFSIQGAFTQEPYYLTNYTV